MLLAVFVADTGSITFQPFSKDKKLNFFSNPDVARTCATRTENAGTGVGRSSTPYRYERHAKESNCCATLQSPPLL